MKLIHKLDQLDLYTSLFNWLLDFLSETPQEVLVSNNIKHHYAEYCC